jgi:hypothetical protein
MCTQGIPARCKYRLVVFFLLLLLEMFNCQLVIPAVRSGPAFTFPRGPEGKVIFYHVSLDDYNNAARKGMPEFYQIFSD